MGNAANMSLSGKESIAPDAQMDIDLSEDDLLGEENDLSEAARDFVGVKKGHSVEVRTARHFLRQHQHACCSDPRSYLGRAGRSPLRASHRSPLWR